MGFTPLETPLATGHIMVVFNSDDVLVGRNILICHFASWAPFGTADSVFILSPIWRWVLGHTQLSIFRRLATRASRLDRNIWSRLSFHAATDSIISNSDH
jgi:hypothetical protein